MHVCMSVHVWKWESEHSVFRNRSSLAIICHFNEKRTGTVCDVWMIYYDQMQINQQLLQLRFWNNDVCSINSNRSCEESVCALLFVLGSLKWFNNPLLFLLMSCLGESSKAREEIKRRRQNKVKKVKSRLRNFGKDGKLSPIIDIDMKRQKCERGMRKHTRNLQDTLACSGIHISQSIRGPIKKKKASI